MAAPCESRIPEAADSFKYWNGYNWFHRRFTQRISALPVMKDSVSAFFQMQRRFQTRGPDRLGDFN
jgi:hypothetical protein